MGWPGPAKVSREDAIKIAEKEGEARGWAEKVNGVFYARL